MDNSIVFEKWPVPKALLKFIIPAVLSQLAALILNLTDAFFVGRTGDTFQISAMTITLPLIMTMTVIASILGAGANANMAAAFGTKNPERARKISVFAVYSAIVLVSVVSVVIAIAEVPMLRLLGANDDSLGHCMGYMRWTLHIGCVPMVFSQVMSQMFSAEGETKIAGIGIAGAGILNALLDPLFIFVLDYGIVGAGMATCAANYCCAVYFLTVYYRRRKKTAISLNPKYYTLKEGICSKVFSIGLPAGLSILLMFFVDFVRNYLIGAYGTQDDLAMWGVVQKLGCAFLQIAIGITMGIRPLVAYNYAAKLIGRTKSMVGGGAVFIAVYSCIVFAAVMLFPEFFINIFLPIPELMEPAVVFMRINIFCVFAIGYNEMFNGVFQAIGRWKIAAVGCVVNKIVLLIPAAFLFARIWGVNGVIAVHPFVDIVMSLAMAVVYFKVMSKDGRRV